MRYIYVLGFLILGHELSIAKDSLNEPLLSENFDKENEYTSTKKHNSNHATKMQLPEKLQQKAAIDFLKQLEEYNYLNTIVKSNEKNKDVKLENTQLYKYANNLKAYLAENECNKELGNVLRNKTVKIFLTNLEKYIKESPEIVSILLKSAHAIIGLPYLCSIGYLKNSDLFLLYVSVILETSALEIACSLKDLAHGSLNNYTENNIEYYKWIANANIESMVRYLRKHAKKIFSMYAKNQEEKCLTLCNELFSNENTNEYIKNSINKIKKYLKDIKENNIKEKDVNKKDTNKQHINENYIKQYNRQIEALQNHILPETHKKDIKQCISMPKTFLADLVEKHYINRQKRKELSELLQNQLRKGHTKVLIKHIKQFLATNDQKMKNDEIHDNTKKLYYSLIEDEYNLEKFVAFFKILEIIDNYKELFGITTEEFKKAHKKFVEQIEEVRRLLKNNLTDYGASQLYKRVNFYKKSFISNAHKHAYIYKDENEINDLADSVMQKITNFVAE